MCDLSKHNDLPRRVTAMECRHLRWHQPGASGVSASTWRKPSTLSTVAPLTDMRGHSSQFKVRHRKPDQNAHNEYADYSLAPEISREDDDGINLDEHDDGKVGGTSGSQITLCHEVVKHSMSGPPDAPTAHVLHDSIDAFNKNFSCSLSHCWRAPVRPEDESVGFEVARRNFQTSYKASMYTMLAVGARRMRTVAGRDNQ